MDYYGKMLATCSSDNRIRIYTIENGASDLLLEIAEYGLIGSFHVGIRVLYGRLAGLIPNTGRC